MKHKDRKKAEEGTLLAEKAWDLIQLAEQINSYFLAEFPEDLGQTSNGTPASFWQMQQFQDTLALEGACTFAIFQCEFGALTPKPTRFVTSLKHFSGNTFAGPPHFDKNWRYLGPLPTSCPHPGAHEALIGTDESGVWKTGPAAHYPGPLCKFLADAIVQTWLESSASVGNFTGGTGEFSADSGEKMVQQEKTDKVDIISGCQGPPLIASYAGRSEEFCDGMGLCSPGRWRPSMRQRSKTKEQQESCVKFRELLDRFCCKEIPDLARATMKVALGRQPCSVFSEEALVKLRQEWFGMLPDPRSASVLEPDQPFFLQALAQSLRLTGDPDLEILEGDSCSYSNGVHLGHITPLGPTPQVFRPRTKEAVYDESEYRLEMCNYFSGTEAEAARILSQQFEEEELAGRMKPLSLAEARKQYPGDELRIAAQGILEKPDGSYRIVHDATHGVQLNNQIKVKDKMDNPGPREMACIMETSIAAEERVIFAVNGDISRAHRREERLGCTSSQNLEGVRGNMAEQSWNLRGGFGRLLVGSIDGAHWKVCYFAVPSRLDLPTDLCG